MIHTKLVKIPHTDTEYNLGIFQYKVVAQSTFTVGNLTILEGTEGGIVKYTEDAKMLYFNAPLPDRSKEFPRRVWVDKGIELIIEETVGILNDTAFINESKNADTITEVVLNYCTIDACYFYLTDSILKIHNVKLDCCGITAQNSTVRITNMLAKYSRFKFTVDTHLAVSLHHIIYKLTYTDPEDLLFYSDGANHLTAYIGQRYQNQPDVVVALTAGNKKNHIVRLLSACPTVSAKDNFPFMLHKMITTFTVHFHMRLGE